MHGARANITKGSPIRFEISTINLVEMSVNDVPVEVKGSLVCDTRRFRGGLVFKARRLCVSLNSRRESNKEEERRRDTRRGAGVVQSYHQPSQPDQIDNVCIKIPEKKQTGSACFLPGIWKQNPSFGLPARVGGTSQALASHN